MKALVEILRQCEPLDLFKNLPSAGDGCPSAWHKLDVTYTSFTHLLLGTPVSYSNFDYNSFRVPLICASRTSHSA